MASGLYTSVPPVLVWLSNNSAPHYKRATAAGLQLAIANCGGFVATFVRSSFPLPRLSADRLEQIYPSAQGPAYVEGHTIVLGLLCAAWVFIGANVAFCHWRNKQKDAGKFDEFIGSGDDRDPAFRYIL